MNIISNTNWWKRVTVTFVNSLNKKWSSLKAQLSSWTFCSALLISVLSSKVKLKSHQPAKSHTNISISYPQHSFWAIISIYFVTIAALNHASCFPFFPCRVWRSFIHSRAGFTLSFYFSDPKRLLQRRTWVRSNPLTFSHVATGLGPKVSLNWGWQEMWMEFPHQTAAWGMVFVYCEARM